MFRRYPAKPSGLPDALKVVQMLLHVDRTLTFSCQKQGRLLAQQRLKCQPSGSLVANDVIVLWAYLIQVSCVLHLD